MSGNGANVIINVSHCLTIVMCRGKDKTNSSLNPIITWSDHSRDPYINNHNNNTLYHSLSLITKSH